MPHCLGSAKDSPADIRSDGEPKEEIDASENTRLKAKSEAASLAALQLVEQNELVVAHLLHMLVRLAKLYSSCYWLRKKGVKIALYNERRGRCGDDSR